MADEALVRAAITVLYQSILSREPDADGLEHWTSRVCSGGNMSDVILAINGSEEATNKRRRSMASDTHILDDIIVKLFRSTQDIGAIIIDIGAQNLEYEAHIYQKLFDIGVVEKVIGFEPLEEKANERNKTENKVEIHPLAVGTGQTGILYINNVDATSSLFPINADIMGETEGLAGLKTVQEKSIATTPLDDFDLPEIIDLLKVDVQGYELPILRHGQTTLSRTNCIYTEVEFQQIYTNQPLFDEVFGYLRSQGFELLSLENQCRLATLKFREKVPHVVGSKLFWADGVFAKPRAAVPISCLPRRALINHFVFAWFDQVYDDLLKYDRAMGTEHSRKYADAL